MEKRDLELIEKYIDYDEELRRYVEQHFELERQIEQFNKRLYLSPEEEAIKKTLQKIKLKGKDKIESILKKYRKIEEDKIPKKENSR